MHDQESVLASCQQEWEHDQVRICYVSVWRDIMKKTIAAMCWVLSLCGIGFPEQFQPPRNVSPTASSIITVPAMANTPGALGGVFKTKAVIFNPTDLSFPIEVTLYSSNGKVKQTIINMAAGQIRNYENFLEEVFGYSGAGTVNFDSLSLPGGSLDFGFLVNSEVYMDSANGRFSTVVTSGPPLDPVSPGVLAYSTGISVDSTSRTNLGCFNASFSTNLVDADVYDSSGKLLTTIRLTVPGASWTQVPLTVQVSGGYISWKPISPAYCYAVVVDNKSNDGTFIPAVSIVH